jgi:hypothetical protein
MSEPRYLLFWRAPERVLELVRQLGSNGDSRSRLLGFGTPMSAFDEEKQLPRRIHTAFATARAHDLAVMLAFDFHIGWRSRPDLWNWFDTNQPSYKAANRRNVEWFGWDGPPAKTRYLNWGVAERMAPPPCLTSAACRKFLAGDPLREKPLTDTPQFRLRRKMAAVEAGFRAWQAAGRDPGPIGRCVEEKLAPLLQAGKLSEAETVLEETLRRLAAPPAPAAPGAATTGK